MASYDETVCLARARGPLRPGRSAVQFDEPRRDGQAIPRPAVPPCIALVRTPNTLDSSLDDIPAAGRIGHLTSRCHCCAQTDA